MPTGDGQSPVETPISDPTYAVMAVVLAGIGVAGLVLGKRPPPAGRFERSRSRELLMIQWFAGAAALVAFFLLLRDPGTTWSADKSETLKSLGRFSILMATAATIAVVVAVRTRRLAPVILVLPAFMADVLLGFRATMVLAIIAALVVWLNGRSLRHALRRQGFILLAVSGVSTLVFVSWQQLYPPLRDGNWPETRERAASPATYFEALRNIEPFLTQAILEKVVEENYRVPPDHLLNVFAVAVPFYTEFFPAPLSFNDRFQPDLFPDVRQYGLASNIWAEAWAVGGMPAVVAYVLIWVVVLWLGSWCLRSKNDHLIVLGAICGAYAAFYVHRNDLLYEAILERRFVIGYLAVASLVWLLRQQGSRKMGFGASVD